MRNYSVQTSALIFLILFSLISSGSEAKNKKNTSVQKLEGQVQRCHDGDTCRVFVRGESLSVRFSGIDTPELKQKYGKEAQKFTENLLKGKNVQLECRGMSFNRYVCEVFLDGLNVNQEIVKNGWAFETPKYSQGKYTKTLNEAKEKRLGIWRDVQVVSPHCFRHKKAKQCRANMAYMP